MTQTVHFSYGLPHTPLGFASFCFWYFASAAPRLSVQQTVRPGSRYSSKRLASNLHSNPCWTVNITHRSSFPKHVTRQLNKTRYESHPTRHLRRWPESTVENVSTTGVRLRKFWLGSDTLHSVKAEFSAYISTNLSQVWSDLIKMPKQQFRSSINLRLTARLCI